MFWQQLSFVLTKYMNGTYCGTTHPMFRSHRQFLKRIVDLTSKVVDFRPSTLNKSRYVSVSSIIFWMPGFQFFCSFLVKIFHCPSLKSHWHWNDGFTQFVRHLMKRNPRCFFPYYFLNSLLSSVSFVMYYFHSNTR